jgi:hypothetical protein
MGGTLGDTDGFLPLQRPRDSPLCVSGVRQPTVQCLRLAGLKRPAISDHALRHAAATLGHLHTGDLRAVQDFLGHADPRMTARYAHVVAIQLWQTVEGSWICARRRLDTILQEFRHGLERIYGSRLVRVVLFGSQAGMKPSRFREHESPLKTRKLFILQNRKNARIDTSAEVRHTAGTRDRQAVVPGGHHEGRPLHSRFHRKTDPHRQP